MAFYALLKNYRAEIPIPGFRNNLTRLRHAECEALAEVRIAREPWRSAIRTEQTCEHGERRPEAGGVEALAKRGEAPKHDCCPLQFTIKNPDHSSVN